MLAFAQHIVTCMCHFDDFVSWNNAIWQLSVHKIDLRQVLLIFHLFLAGGLIISWIRFEMGV